MEIPKQLGINAVWDGPYKSPLSDLAKGNSRSGENCMQVSKSPLPYTAGPISSRAQAMSGGSIGSSHMAMGKQPLVK